MTTIPEIYVKESNVLDDYKPNPNILIDKRFLKYIHRLNYLDPIYEAPKAKEIYPFCNAYYQYTEDVDAVNRVCHYLDEKPSEQSINSCDKSSAGGLQEVNLVDDNKDPYSEQNAHVKYLKQSPVCFLILGKPEIGEQMLGKMLSDYWNCVYIHPETLIQEEISSESRAGMCIEFNLRCGRAVSSDVILRLLEKRMKSKSVAHRGFVICGFPLICNDLFAEDPVSSESAIFNVHDIFDELFDNIFDHQEQDVKRNVSKEGSVYDVETEVQPTEKLKPTDSDLLLDVGSTNIDLCLPPEIGTNYEDQMQLIFNNCNYPLIIIYLKCSNEDVVNHRLFNRIDPLSVELVNLQYAKSDKLLYTVYARYPHLSEEVQNDLTDVSNFDDNRKLLKLQRDYPAHVNTQLERYRVEAHSVTEKYVLLHDPQYIIRLDGRITPSRMFNALKARLHVLPIQQASVPERMIQRLQNEELGEGAVAVEEFNYEESTNAECFEHIHKKKIVGNLFKWSLSNWGFHCPVSMFAGVYVQGLPQFAVHFMNKIYFLANDEAYMKFKTNPRPYLLPPFPKPRCRVFVLGPDSSGRTAVAKCLCYILNGDLLSPEKILESYVNDIRNEFIDNCKSVAITQAIEQLKEKQKEEFNELERQYLNAIAEFVENVKEKIKRKIECYQILANFDTTEFSTFAMPTRRTKPDEIIKVELEYIDLDTYFNSINFPRTDDIHKNIQLYEDKDNFIATLIPESLKKPSPFNEDSISISSHQPFVQQFISDALEDASIEFNNNPQLNMADVSKSFKEAFHDNEEKFRKAGISGGWIVDALPLNVELLDSFKPDYLADIIYILNDEPGHKFLMERFKTRGQHEFSDYRNMFLALGKPDAAWRCPSNISTKSYKQQAITSVLNDILDEVYEVKERHEIIAQELDKEQVNEDTVNNIDDESMLEAEEIEKQAIKEFYDTHMPRESQIQYAKKLTKFDAEYEQVIDWFNKNNVDFTLLKLREGKSIKDLLLEVIANVDSYYTQLASIFTPEDRVHEVEDSGEHRVQDEEIGGEDAETDEDRAEKESLFNANRRFGDTYDYCPITYSKYWVLWKGKEEYALKYQNRLYFFCSEEAMNEFLPIPSKFLLKHNPPLQYPPPRICIVGLPGSGKTTLAKALHRRLGLYYANFEMLIKETSVQGDKLERYFTSDEPFEDTVLDQVLKPFWFNEPFKSTGFVFDGFPRRPSDVDYMYKTACIPDMIIELSIPEYELNDRVFNNLIQQWRIQMEADQSNEEERYRRVLDEWETNRKRRTEELLEIKKQERYAAKVHMVSESDIEDETNKSQISYKSVEEADDLEAVKALLDKELPEPAFNYEWETLDQATERLKLTVDDMSSSEADFIGMLHEHCEAEQIPWISIDAKLDILKVYNQAVRVALPLHTRIAIFERTYDISIDIAERLLTQGYYFLSQFGRSCPVQVLEKYNPIQMITALESKFQIFPIIYRNYIYFLAGKNNRLKFKNNPIKYVDQVSVFPLIQIRIAVIGPPKCGKTSLAERLCEEYGFKHISLGKAIRYVLKFLEHSALAKEVENILRAGDELSDELTIKCVEAMGFDGRAIAQGILMDGFPNNIYEVRELAKYNMVPHLIFDLEATPNNIHECTRFDKGKFKLVYSNTFIDLRYSDWLRKAQYFRDWNYIEYQNLTKIAVDFTKWNVYTEANEILLSTVFEIKHYMKHVGEDCALHISTMLITPLEFIQRQSSYKYYCPVCLHQNCLTPGGDPPDRTGLVQYKEYFYYLCQEHIEEFIDNPKNYIPPNNNHSLPEDLPIRVILNEMPDNQENVHLNCNVCYADNKPERIVHPGLLEFAVRYKDSIYLFDTLACLLKFMKTPGDYYHVVYSKSIIYPPLNYEVLPTLGLLEQFDSMQLIKAIIDSHRLRPFVPGLDISQSALINIGLYLKIHNPLTHPDYIPLYIEGKKRFLAHSRQLLDQLNEMKKEINPYLHYEEPLPVMCLDSVHTPVSSSSNFSMTGIVDEMLNQINYD